MATRCSGDHLVVAILKYFLKKTSPDNNSLHNNFPHNRNRLIMVYKSAKYVRIGDHPPNALMPTF